MRNRTKLLKWTLLAGVVLTGWAGSIRHRLEKSLAVDREAACSTEDEPTIVEPYRIEITGTRGRWHVRYPGCGSDSRRNDGSQPAHDIHVPQNADIVLILNSADYIYTLKVPEFGVKQIAVPDLEFRAEFRSDREGTFELTGDELCGDRHPEMNGHLIVEPRQRFLKWLAAADSASAD
jgi:heme/copper-type cytochrome/quinol oxidase subunit 2